MSNKSTGCSSDEMRLRHAEWAGEQPATTSCAFCDWTYAGTVAEGRQLAAGHRRVHHPDKRATRRRRSSLTRWLAQDDGFRAEAIENAAKVATTHARREAAA